MIRVALLLAVLLSIPVAAQDADEFVIIPRSEVREILHELKRLRTEVETLNDRLVGCRA